MYEAGNLKLDELVTQKYKLDDINEAMKDLRAGKNIRGVIEGFHWSLFATIVVSPVVQNLSC